MWAELRDQSRMLRSLGINHSGKAEEIKGKKKRIRIWRDGAIGERQPLSEAQLCSRGNEGEISWPFLLSPADLLLVPLIGFL